jgi:hypothetical protein
LPPNQYRSGIGCYSLPRTPSKFRSELGPRARPFSPGPLVGFPWK